MPEAGAGYFEMCFIYPWGELVISLRNVGSDRPEECAWLEGSQKGIGLRASAYCIIMTCLIVGGTLFAFFLRAVFIGFHFSLLALVQRDVAAHHVPAHVRP
jgi:hypothetical protein